MKKTSESLKRLQKRRPSVTVFLEFFQPTNMNKELYLVQPVAGS